MQYVNFGSTGMKVSRLCLGCMTYGTPKWREWVLDEEASKPFFRQAIEAGINFFDTADIYSLGVSEEVTGRALKDLAKRDDVVIATKVCQPMGPGPNDKGLSRKRIMYSIDRSLKRLGTDHVDLYQIHRLDHDTPYDEIMEALHDVVKAGKALHIGASSMFAYQLAQMQQAADRRQHTRFISMQNHYNLIYREEEREMIPYCREEKMALMPWSPLARGFLTGNRHKQGYGDTKRAKTDDLAQKMYYDDSDFEVVDRVAEIAAKRRVPAAQVALAWMLAKPHITSPIIGASKPGHLNDAIAALDIKLDAEEVKLLEQPYRPHRVLGHS